MTIESENQTAAMPKEDRALVRATFCGRGNTCQADMEMSTDLPADALGELVAEVLQRAWRLGEDPCGCAVTLVFHTIVAEETDI